VLESLKGKLTLSLSPEQTVTPVKQGSRKNCSG